MYNPIMETRVPKEVLTEPQLPQVLEPPAMAAEHLGQVLCMFALLGLRILVFRGK